MRNKIIIGTLIIWVLVSNLFANTVPVEKTFKIDVHKGWNLVSFPVEKVVDLNLNGAVLYEYADGRYVPVKFPVYGKGYWIFSNRDSVITFSGTPTKSVKLSLRKGQPVYIGGPDCEVKTKLKLYYYDPSSRSYVPTDRFTPGKGYYVKPEVDGEVVLTCPEEECDITECTTITTPGYHALCNDIYEYFIGGGTCIRITSDNVILDGKSHSIINTNYEEDTVYRTNGILISGVKNVSVSNITVKNFYEDIKIYRSNYTQIKNCTTIGEWYGIVIWEGSHNNATNNNVQNCKSQGILLHAANYSQIQDNFLKNNSLGIKLEISSKYNIIANNDIVNNSGTGIMIQQNSTNNIISNNDIRFNEYSGIYLWLYANNNTISNNHIQKNEQGGITSVVGYFGESSDYNNISNNFVCGNLEYDIRFESTLNIFSGNTCNTTNPGSHDDYCDYWCGEEEEEECVDLTDPDIPLCDDYDPSTSDWPVCKRIWSFGGEHDYYVYEIYKNITLCEDRYNYTGLTFKADNITLDCNHAIISSPVLSNPNNYMIHGIIEVYDRKNVTVKNCCLEQHTPQRDGLYLIHSRYCHFENLTIIKERRHNTPTYGIMVQDSWNNTFSNITISRFKQGFAFFGTWSRTRLAQNNTVTGLTACCNGPTGDVVFHDFSRDNTVDCDKCENIIMDGINNVVTGRTGPGVCDDVDCECNSCECVESCTFDPEGYSFSEIGEEKEICGIRVKLIDVDVVKNSDCSHVFYFNVSTPTESRVIGLSETGMDSDTVGGYYFTLLDGNIERTGCSLSANAILQITEGSGEVFNCYANGYTFVPLGEEICNGGDCATLVDIAPDYDGDEPVKNAIFRDTSGNYHVLHGGDTDTIGSSKLSVCDVWSGYWLNLMGAWVKWTSEPDTVDDCIGYDTFNLGTSETIGGYTFRLTDIMRDNCEEKPLCYYANIKITGPGVNENLKLKEHGSIIWDSPDGHHYRIFACDIEHGYGFYANYAKLKIDEVGTPGEDICEGYAFSHLIAPSETDSLYSPYPEYRILFDFGTRNIDPDDPNKFAIPALFYVMDSEDNIVKVVKVFPGHPVVWNSPYGPIRFDVCELFYGSNLYARWIKYNISAGSDGETYCDDYNLIMVGDSAEIGEETMTLSCTYPSFTQRTGCYNRYAEFTDGSDRRTLNLSSPNACDIGIPSSIFAYRGEYVYYSPRFLRSPPIDETENLSSANETEREPESISKLQPTSIISGILTSIRKLFLTR